MLRELFAEIIPRFLVTAGVFYLNWYAFTSEGIPSEMKYALLTLLGSSVGYWLGTSASSASKNRTISKELLQDDNQQIAPAYPTAKPGKPLAERLRDNANSVDS